MKNKINFEMKINLGQIMIAISILIGSIMIACFLYKAINLGAGDISYRLGRLTGVVAGK